MLKNIFGDYIWINSFDASFNDNYKKHFFLEKDNINTNTWTYCSVSSSYFNNEFINNYRSLDFNGMISKQITEEFHKFTKQIEKYNNVSINLTPILKNLWYNNYNFKDNQELHDHISDSNAIEYSFVYILKQTNNGKSASLIFPNHNLNIISISDKLIKKINIDDYSKIYKPTLNEGDIIIFPSYMQHYVSSHKDTDNNRITISGNILI